MSEIKYVIHIVNEESVLNRNIYQVTYKSNRLRNFFGHCPKTVKRFMEQAWRVERDDELYGRLTIYME